MIYVIKPSDIYLSGRPEIPGYWEVADFRPPLKGEHFIGLFGSMACADGDGITSPYLILKRKEKDPYWWWE